MLIGSISCKHGITTRHHPRGNRVRSCNHTAVSYPVRMARPLRLEFPGAVYHLTSRGNARQEIYRDEMDRETFLALVGQVCTQWRWRCYAYCLMNNHYHLVVETLDGRLAAGMRQLNGVYTQHFNRRHRRTGHVFQGRYKAILVERESSLLAVLRYVVLNPVRARLVQRPEGGGPGAAIAQPWAWQLRQAGCRWPGCGVSSVNGRTLLGSATPPLWQRGSGSRRCGPSYGSRSFWGAKSL